MTLALNYLIAFLLLLTILFCWRLNRKMVAIHKSKKEMLILLKYFDSAVVRAEESIKQLKHAGASAGKLLQGDIEKAQLLVNDLNFMIERAAATADKLETSIAGSRDFPSSFGAGTYNKPSPTDTRAPSFRLTPSSKIAANKPFVAETGEAKEKPASKRSSIEILLDRLAGKQGASTVPKDQRIPYKTPEELGALGGNVSSSGKEAKDLMQLLKGLN